MPHWVLAIEASLRKLFEPRKRDYDLKLSGNFVSEAERVAREFSALATPSAEAAYSIDLFMRKYFIDDTGKPDKTKRPDPLPLPGFPNRARIHAATEHVPGLVSVSGGRDNDRTVVIGWDDGLVESVAREIGSHQSAKKKVADEAEWDSLMQKHRKLVRSSEKAVPGKRFSIESARGRYIIKCDSASSYSLDDSNKLRLRITEGSEGWVGIMDFGILEGIMLLGEDREDVASRAQQSRDDTSYDSEDSEPADYEQSSEEECETPVRATKKRPAVSLRRGPPSKRPKRSRSGGDVLYFQWRGEETGEGEVQLDPSNKHVGHLNFLDASGMKFNGMASFGFLGDKVRFQGFKIGGLGGPASRSWYDYSEAAYEQARVGRWH